MERYNNGRFETYPGLRAKMGEKDKELVTT